MQVKLYAKDSELDIPKMKLRPTADCLYELRPLLLLAAGLFGFLGCLMLAW
jgi:hypothetical protein